MGITPIAPDIKWITSIAKLNDMDQLALFRAAALT
jgi:hypothetical protein